MGDPLYGTWDRNQIANDDLDKHFGETVQQLMDRLDRYIPIKNGKTAKSNGQDAPVTGLPWIDTSKWDNEPCPQREWAVLDRVPLRQVTLFSGEGAIGNRSVRLAPAD